MRGARAALEPLLRDKGAFRLGWAFIDMMKSDGAESAAAAAARVDAARMTAFHDPKHLLGRAMAQTLGWRQHLAWDTYFVYPPGIRWTDGNPPVPTTWFHQLQDRETWERIADAEVGSSEWTARLAEKSEADPARFRTGEALRRALVDAVDSETRRDLAARLSRWEP